MSSIYRLVLCVENIDHEGMNALSSSLGLSFVQFASIVKESYELTETFNQNFSSL
ncbi:MAG: hypothetical protein R3302_09835 [Sulfurimonadaceae bacterium]|nr:hypothetical protein [Sulfurimonadaceae bacterium]